MSKETPKIIQTIIQGIQEKKGSHIVIANLSNIQNAICSNFVICQGNAPAQIEAIVESISDSTRIHHSLKPVSIDGLTNAQWVAMDYSDILVHVFLPETRNFYDLEHLWADAELTEIPDLD